MLLPRDFVSRRARSFPEKAAYVDGERSRDWRYLYLVDRKKFMIISGGYNVYPVVVENMLAEHEAVREVSVVGAAHPEWGEVAIGVVSLLPGTTATPEELIEFCRGKVGKWEVPKHVKIVDELPKGSTAKVQKHEIRDWFRKQPERLPWHALAET